MTRDQPLEENWKIELSMAALLRQKVALRKRIYEAVGQLTNEEKKVSVMSCIFGINKMPERRLWDSREPAMKSPGECCVIGRMRKVNASVSMYRLAMK